MSSAVCGGHRGRYVVARDWRWHGNRKYARCDCTRHRGPRRRPISEIVVFTLALTENELHAAIEEFDLWTLEAEPKFVCRTCYERGYRP